MDDLVVNDQLTTAVVDDKGTDGATTIVKGALDFAEEAVVVDDGEALLDVAGLGHADEEAVVTDVKDAVLLEDGAEHALHIDRWLGVGVEARLLLQLLGEEVHAEVAVLTSLGRQADTDDLARTALQNHKVADADKVAGDGYCVEARHGAAGLNKADLITSSVSNAAWTGNLLNGFGTAVVRDLGGVVVMVVVTMREWVD